MAYAAVASLLQTLDYFMQYFPFILDLKIREVTQRVLTVGNENQVGDAEELLRGLDLMIKSLRETGGDDSPLSDVAVMGSIVNYWMLKDDVSLTCGVYQLTTVVHRDLCFLLTCLDHSMNFPISEDVLKCITQLSDKAKDVIEQVTLRHPINQESIKALSVWDTEEATESESDFMRIWENLVQVHKEMVSFKVEIASKHINVDDNVPSSKLHGISPTDRKEGIVVDFVDEELILERLITNDAQPGLEIVSIVGMGGVGKTTLAKKLFDHPYTVFHFDCRAWITISQVYVVRDLLLALLSSFAHKSDEMSNAELREALYRSLKCKRYLIVLDDMWSVDAWNDVKGCFPDDKTGSRIIVTSRFIELANLLSLKPPHFMNLFEAEKSWELFQKLVCRNAVYPSELVEVGKQIAKRCRGLPLAIVVIAGVLCSTPMTLESWAHIAENLNSIVATDPEQCLDILALSYVYLPYRLRACFLYMGAFPEDCEIEAQKLISLWVAEGFLYSRSQENLEQIAEEYLEDLVGRNLVMVEKRYFGGRVKTCRLHDFVRELCLIEAGKENFMNVTRRGNCKNVSASLRNQRRLSFHMDPFSNVPQAPELPQVSSFLCFSLGSTIVPDILFFQMEFKLLRVLDVYFLKFEYFPEQILRMVHLRYLALNVTFQLPDGLSLLKNLQTFVIQGPWRRPGLDSCPTFNIKYWIMPLLRHLHTSVAIELMDPLMQQEDLLSLCAPKSLQILSTIRFSSCRPRVFEVMPNLKRLHMCEMKDDYINDRSCVFLNNLAYLQELVTLKCCFYRGNQKLRQILCLNAFPKNLRQLSLSWSYLPWEDMTIVSRLPNLQVLKLKNYAFQGPKWLVVEEGFPKLECLLIDNADLVHWDATVHQFQRLHKLILKICRQLEEIPFGIYEIGSLHRMEVHYCSNPLEVLAKEIQEQNEGVDVIIKTDMSRQDPQAGELVRMKIDELNLRH